MATYSGSDKRLQYLFQHGGGGSLEDLDDVEITNPTDGDALVYDGEEEKWVNGEGGGGNANEQVLTKAEYDALTEEQKMNNTTYYINDADTWTSKEVQPVIYSTEEREVGVWTDGKPLYQKTWDLGSDVTIPTGTWTNVSIVVADWNIEKIVNTFATNSEGTSWNMFGASCNGTNVRLFHSRGSNLTIRHLTLFYTKTTDQAGSGIYTPQGQLAVHYSTDEHVIGTWIDGSTIYEKTIEFATAIQTSTAGSWVNTGISLASMSIDKMISGQALDGVGQCYPTNLGRMSNDTYIGIAVGTANRYISVITIQYTKTTD